MARGLLVAVCGLCGGAGASTLAYLMARDGAGGELPTLLCDTGGPMGGLSAYAGIQSPRSLPIAASAIARGERLAGGLFADAGGGLRLIATEPDLAMDCEPGAVGRLLSDARDAHGLTVVDCGTLSGRADREALAAATHVVWVLPATASGVRRASGALHLVAAVAATSEVVVARADAAGGAPPMADLAALAAQRAAPLVLMPHIPDLFERSAKEALEAATLTLHAIQGVLAR